VTVPEPAPRRDESPYPKADLTLRGLARLADFTIALGIAGAAPGVGPLVAAAYLLFADGLVQGQSPGKKIFGVRAVALPRRQGVTFQESALRNAPFALVTVFWSLPILWPVFFMIGIPVVGYEAWRAWDDPLGKRLGDLLADSQVVDTKVLTRAEELARGLAPTAHAPPGQSARTARPEGALDHGRSAA
jgi:uncharacterized RDD family membrane protein YckC